MYKVRHNLIIVSIILLSGAMGGVANYMFNDLLLDGESVIDIITKAKFRKSVMLGIVAAAIMPLFLNIISSDLLEADKHPSNSRRYFIFTSLCLLVALFSTRFLDSMYDQAVADNTEAIKELKTEGDKVKEEAVRVKETAEAAAEAPIITHKIEESKGAGNTFEEVISRNQLSIQEKAVLSSVYSANGVVFEDDLLIEMSDLEGGKNIILSLVSKKLLKRYEIDGDFALQLRMAAFEQ